MGSSSFCLYYGIKPKFIEVIILDSNYTKINSIIPFTCDFPPYYENSLVFIELYSAQKQY
jgi:hypothetical protein